MSHFFDESQSQLIVNAIALAEKKTSGEIRIHIEDFCSDGSDGNPYTRAKEVFYLLQMDQTKNRTGVLIYIATEDRKVAIIGDEGIHTKVSDEFWQQNILTLIQLFKEAKYLEGLIAVIEEIGKVLENYFPEEAINPNELSNEISYGDI